MISIVATTLCGAQAAMAQAAPPTNLVSACSGVSLPRSVVTDIVRPVITGIVTPVQATVNPILGVVGGALPLVPPLNIDAAGLLANAAAGNPITLQVLNNNGTIVGPADRCDLQADSYTLRTPQGLAIGGNRITGLGAAGLVASAGEANSIALGNSATTSASAAGAIALGAQSSVGPAATGSVALGTGANATGANGVALGAGSIAARGPLTNYTAVGLTGAQTSAGEVSIGAPGAARQLTNVAAGTAATDAANVGQLTGVQAQIGAVAANAVLYDGAAHDRITLSGANGSVIGNLAAGTVAAGSTEAVNGSQLFATNIAVTNATTAITTTNTALTTLTSNVTNGAIGPVRYSNAATPTVPNGGTPSNDVTLVGVGAGPVGLHDVANGVVAAGSTDAVNGGQLATVAGQVTGLTTLAVQYDDPSRARVTLGGIGSATPVTIGNVAAGSLAIGSTDAVNGGQLSGLGQSVATGLGGASRYDPVTGTVVASIAVGGTQYGSVQSAFNAVDGAISGGAGIRYFHVLSTRPDSMVTGTDSIAIGPEANASAGNSVALGAGSVATRGATTGYTAVGLTGAQTSAGEVSIGAPGAARQLTNVAAGTAATDAANVGQVAGVAAQVVSLGNTSVQYDGTDKTRITLGGAGGTTITNVTAGMLAAGSTDVVNGAQLFATNVQVVNNTSAITNLGNQISSGGTGPVQYSNAGTPTTPNGGTKTNDLTLVGAAAAPVALHNVASGSVVTGSTDAVNGGQLATTNQAVVAAQGTASTALALGNNSVQYGPGRTNVTFNAGGTSTVLSNVAAGIAATDAANVGQLAGVAAQVTALGNSSVQYDDTSKTRITLGGAGGTTITNVAPGTLAAGSTDVVNGGQLFATNVQVATNTSAITNLGNQISSGGMGPVQYSNAGAPTTPNGGTKTNDLTLVGAAAAPVALHNVASGLVATGSTDAVNGGQLATTNQAVTAAQGTASTALALGNNSVQYGPGRTNVTFNAGGTATVLSNVAAGTSTTDAVNVGQLNAGLNSAVTQSNAYTDGRIAALNFDLRAVRRDSFAGTSSALAAAGLPQAYEAGKGMIALGGGTYAGQSAIAFGASKAFNDGHTVMKLSGTYDSQGRAGASGGVGYQF